MADVAAKQVKKIVLLGSGYTSFYAYKVLKRKMGARIKKGEVEVTVVSPHNYHYFHGFIGEMISGVVSIAGGLSASRAIFEGVRFVKGWVSRVDSANNRVHVRVHGSGVQQEVAVEYDQLVVGVG